MPGVGTGWGGAGGALSDSANTLCPSSQLSKHWEQGEARRDSDVFWHEASMAVSGVVCATADSHGLCSHFVLRMPCHQTGQLVMPRRLVACLVLLQDRRQHHRRTERAFLGDEV